MKPIAVVSPEGRERSPQPSPRGKGGPAVPSKTFAIVTLGCTKNVVDSEGIEQTLVAHGHTPVDDPSLADAVIVNTCGFIGPSKQESIDTILRLAADKRPDQTLIASGCLIERY